MTFEVELERPSPLYYAASAGVIAASVLIALHVLPMFLLLPFLVASALGRRMSASKVRVEVDTENLTVGTRTIPMAAVHDVWLDADAVEPRVTLAFGEAAEVMSFRCANVAQARELDQAVGERPRERAVAGTKPRWVDTLASVRFIAIAAAFFATGSQVGLLVLVFFFLGAWSLGRAKQVMLGADGFELRGLLGSTSYRYVTVRSVDTEEGVVYFDDSELAIPHTTLRDAAMTSPPWLLRARTRALDAIAAVALSRRKRDHPVSDTSD